MEPDQTKEKTSRRPKDGLLGREGNQAKRQEEKNKQEPRRGRKNPWEGTRLDEKEKNLEKEPKDEKEDEKTGWKMEPGHEDKNTQGRTPEGVGELCEAQEGGGNPPLREWKQAREKKKAGVDKKEKK